MNTIVLYRIINNVNQYILTICEYYEIIGRVEKMNINIASLVGYQYKKCFASTFGHVAVVMFLVITASSVPWFLSKDKLAYTVPIISSGRLNTRTPYTTLTPIRLSNKLTAGAAITSGAVCVCIFRSVTICDQILIFNRN